MTARKPVVVVLEDTPSRVHAIERALGSDFRLEHHETAQSFVAWLVGSNEAALISLDYHLGGNSIGSGLDAAKALAQHPPFAQVILHSSDSVGARAQQRLLSEAGWETEFVPFQEYAWAATLARLFPATG